MFIVIEENSLSVAFASEHKAHAKIFCREKQLEAFELASERIRNSNGDMADMVLKLSDREKRLARAFGAYDYTIHSVDIDSDQKEFVLSDKYGYTFAISRKEIEKVFEQI